MPAFSNPALTEFVSSIREEFVLAQVLIRRESGGFELRHVSDRLIESGRLRKLDDSGMRPWVQFTSTGLFRPLKSAPNLRAGWKIFARTEQALESALNLIYPGAIADWFAAQSPCPPITHYREFTARQTGMYRITAMLEDSPAARMTKVCCHPDFCLKQRLWTVSGLPADDPAGKSYIPCLEPCALLLEFARKAMRIEQEASAPVQSSERQEASKSPGADELDSTPVREADFESPLNPRRRRLELERLEIPPGPADGDGTSDR